MVSGVARFTASPDALNYFARHYTPTRAQQIPTVTLHTVLDPVVPLWHEAAAITPAETASAFDALVGWADGGPKPAGGDATIR